jgi:AcrR family transcriptional regulator
MTAAQSELPRRERARAATIEEIKATALDLMRETGTTEARFTDIARVMGMTPPALYRYFADHDELLTALIIDAYDDLGRAVAESRDAVAEHDIGGRWLAAAEAYRAWAHREPQQFALIFGLPVPGYLAPQEGQTTEAASRAMSQLAALFTEAHQTGKLRQPIIREVEPSFSRCADGETKFSAIPTDNFQAMMHAWASLHGFTCLEAFNHLDWMEADARDALFRAQVRLAAKAAGLPAPARVR